MLARVIVPGLLALGLLFSFSTCSGVRITKYHRSGAVASAAPIATEVGVQVIKSGGNAFDAAVATALALAVVHPEAGNLGGGGFAVIRDGATDRIQTLDFRETAPLAATADMYLDDTGAVIPDLSTFGAKAAGVPGSVAGLYELWKNHGSKPWAELVHPAALLADTGFIVDEYHAATLAENREGLTAFEETADIFFPGGQPLKAGDRLTQKDLASTLYAIMTEGPDGFYSGPVAEKIVASMEAHGGLITAADLAGYRPVWREPIHFTFDSLDIYSMAPPSSGGIIIAQILKLIEPYDFSTYTPNSPEYIHPFTEAARLAYADRSVHLGDPAFYDIPSGLLDSAYLVQRRSLISLDHAGSSEQVSAGNPMSHESDQTTHLSVCDKDGNMVAITTTLNTAYGCKLVVDGAGLLLNNEMDDFSVKPGVPNYFGLIGAEANKIEPGKRMLSSMSPTLVLENGEPLLILGSPGGSKIITTVAQAIIDFDRFHMTVDEIVAQPRFHHQWLPDVLYLERDGYSESTIAALEKYGHTVEERTPYGDLQIIYIDPAGLMAAASDPRNDGASGGY